MENIVWLLSLHKQVFKKSRSWPTGLGIGAQTFSGSADRLSADLRKGITDDIQIMLQLVHGAGYALGVFQYLNTPCVWIILHSKWTLNCFGKFSI